MLTGEVASLARTWWRMPPLALLLIGPVALGLDASMSAQVAAQGTTASFRHTSHVSRLWWNRADVPEYAQDCRGCHDYSAAPGEASLGPTGELCARCHVPPTMSFSGASAIDPAREAERAFRHYDHRSQECRQCHGKEVAATAGREPGTEVPAALPVPEPGVLFCISCHAEGEMRDSLYRGLNRRDAATAPPRFLHSDHLGLPVGDLAQLSESSRCDPCHTGVQAASERSLGQRQFDAGACEGCHLGERFETEPVQRASSTAATFLHSQHLGSGLTRDPHSIQTARCLSCHRFDAQAGREGTFALHQRFQGDAYRGCLDCHNERRVPDHGRVGRCQQCHAIQEGSLTRLVSMLENRPRVRAPRPVPSSFDFGDHSHPHITTAQTGAVDQDCARCHRASREELRSRLQGRRFDHGTHVPDLSGSSPAQIAAACSSCHEDVRGSDAPSAEAGWTSYDPASCGECHLGGSAAVQVLEQERSLLAFAHRPHLKARVPREDGSGQRFVHCLDCHEPRSPQSTEPAGRYGLKLEVAKCSHCHGHANDPPVPIPEQLTGDDVLRCAECHTAGIPMHGEPVPVERLILTGRGGRHQHGLGGDRRGCAECHLELSSSEQATVATRPPRSGLTSERLAGHAVHDPAMFEHGYRKRFFEDRFQGLPAAQATKGTLCLRCHWHRTDNQVTKVYDYQLPKDELGRRDACGTPITDPAAVGLPRR